MEKKRKSNGKIMAKKWKNNGKKMEKKWRKNEKKMTKKMAKENENPGKRKREQLSWNGVCNGESNCNRGRMYLCRNLRTLYVCTIVDMYQ